eukprot:CAMPEP_0194688170 /NCGR_PEP_ID=MMETSP0295-20121207/16752_1 /TAXON_ID=39354 /ORGANISM="Heterosigma akashiwo, Strain CCMP2393" /LENGTH=50 /DNA_ID=CAMNT_0039576761 /DNA_START=537 /DNA_END=689 /DNA_ORIENTATION=+
MVLGTAYEVSTSSQVCSGVGLNSEGRSPSFEFTASNTFGMKSSAILRYLT